MFYDVQLYFFTDGLYDKKCGESITCLIGNLFLESLLEVQSVWGNSRRMAIRYIYLLPCFLPKNLKKSEIVVNMAFFPI
jgi:hypothetical protein